MNKMTIFYDKLKSDYRNRYVLTERGSENMNKQNLLLKKTDREYEKHIYRKRNQTPDEIIANAEEIAGIKLMYDAVKSGTFSEEGCEYLLTLRKPLQTMYLHHEMDENLYDDIGRLIEDEELEDFMEQKQGGMDLC